MRHNDPTDRLERLALRYLRRQHRGAAAAYNLKRGMMQLGPAGFLFEQYLGLILREYGYKVATNQQIAGECVVHEIDVSAFMGKEHLLVEAKYRNSRGIKTDVEVVMYAYARTLDIAAAHDCTQRRESRTHNTWVMTNTRFTSSAIRYGECKGLRMTGWNYPSRESLQELIEAKNLYPVTVLLSVGKGLREMFMQHNLILARDLLKYDPQELERVFRLSGRMAREVRQEAAELAQMQGKA